MPIKGFIITRRMIIIRSVDMHKENLEAKELIRYSPIKEEQIYFQNGK